MADDDIAKEVEGGLDDALRTMEQLQSRLEAGEEIDEKELTVLARMVATQMETVRAQLEAALGPIDPEQMNEHMKGQLEPHEFEEWLEGEQERLKFREELEREQALREQLGEGGSA